MGKAQNRGKGKSIAKARAGTGAGTGAAAAAMVWPTLGHKRPPLDGDSVDWTLPDQLGVVHAFLSTAECGALVAACAAQRFEPSPPARRGEASRSNERWALEDAAFARVLWGKLAPACAAWVGAGAGAGTRGGGTRGLPASGLNANIRVYKYAPGQAFGAHYDGTATDPATGKKTEWTLLVYLTGEQDGVVGGETVFYRDHTRRQDKQIVMPLERGAALLHRHGDVRLLRSVPLCSASAQCAHTLSALGHPTSLPSIPSLLPQPVSLLCARPDG